MCSVNHELDQENGSYDRGHCSSFQSEKETRGSRPPHLRPSFRPSRCGDEATKKQQQARQLVSGLLPVDDR
eukprot:SAG31_NODE_20492_length_573_cov_0.605485_1_plen_70_part_10